MKVKEFIEKLENAEWLDFVFGEKTKAKSTGASLVGHLTELEVLDFGYNEEMKSYWVKVDAKKFKEFIILEKKKLIEFEEKSIKSNEDELKTRKEKLKKLKKEVKKMEK